MAPLSALTNRGAKMSVEYEKIFNWLENVEGKMTCRGYIPCHKNSGGTANYY